MNSPAYVPDLWNTVPLTMWDWREALTQTRRGTLLLDLSLGSGRHHGAGEQGPDAPARRLPTLQPCAGLARSGCLRLPAVSQATVHAARGEAVLEAGLVVGAGSRFDIVTRRACGT